MMEPDIDLRPLDERSLDHVWTNLRAKDRRELELQGINDSNYRDRVMATRHKWTCLDGDGPFGVCGAVERDGAFWVFWFSTNKIMRYMRLFTEMAIPFLDQLRHEMFGKRCMVEVWEEHWLSRHWLANLGFTDEGTVVRNGQPFKVMEYRGPHGS